MITAGQHSNRNHNVMCDSRTACTLSYAPQHATRIWDIAQVGADMPKAPEERIRNASIKMWANLMRLT